MAITAPQIQYRSEYIQGFERHQALLRMTVTTETVIKGNQATFLVVDSGAANAVTRGVNGLIPARNDNNNQYTATLVEWHDLVEKTGFNIFQSQGDQRKAMQMTSRAVLNRRIDADIITELNTGTQDTGAVTTANLMMALRAKAILGNAAVPFDGAGEAALDLVQRPVTQHLREGRVDRVGAGRRVPQGEAHQPPRGQLPHPFEEEDAALPRPVR